MKKQQVHYRVESRYIQGRASVCACGARGTLRSRVRHTTLTNMVTCLICKGDGAYKAATEAEQTPPSLSNGERKLTPKGRAKIAQAEAVVVDAGRTVTRRGLKQIAALQTERVKPTLTLGQVGPLTNGALQAATAPQMHLLISVECVACRKVSTVFAFEFSGDCVGPLHQFFHTATDPHRYDVGQHYDVWLVPTGSSVVAPKSNATSVGVDG